MVIFTLLALLLVRLWMAYALPLTDTTEARYAEMTRKMVELSNWITPMFDYGVPFWGKPPLSFWVSAIGMELFGSSEFAVRSGILISTLFFMVFFYRWMRSNHLSQFALATLLMLSSSLLFFVSSAVVMTDMILMICTCLSLMFFWKRLSGGPFKDECLFYIALGAGLLAKGPIAVIFVAFPVIGWLWLNHQFPTALKIFSPLKGLFIVLLVALPWYLLAEWKTPGFLNYFIVNEHIKRFLIGGFVGDLYGNPHPKPLGSIWLFWLAAFFPWSLYALVSGLFSVKRVLQNYRDHKLFIQFLILWILAPLVLFTFAHNTIWTYPLPALPATILLLAILIKPSEKKLENRQLIIISLLSLTMTIIYLNYSFRVGQNNKQGIKRSQKELVIAFKKQCPEKSCQLLYWQKRFYSADYYSQGTAKVIQNEKEFRRYQQQNKKIYLAFNRKITSTVPQSILDHFQLNSEYYEMQLWEPR